MIDPALVQRSGTIRFDVPSVVRGEVVTGVVLSFEAGRVVASSAERGGDVLAAALATDGGASTGI